MAEFETKKYECHRSEPVVWPTTPGHQKRLGRPRGWCRDGFFSSQRSGANLIISSNSTDQYFSRPGSQTHCSFFPSPSGWRARSDARTNNNCVMTISGPRQLRPKLWGKPGACVHVCSPIWRVHTHDWLTVRTGTAAAVLMR